jgi:isoamylase
MLNAYWDPLTFELPASAVPEVGQWRRWIDTALPSPEDIAAWEEAALVTGAKYSVGPRSMALLIELAP